MRGMIGNWSGGVIRILVLGLLVWLGWAGTMPVMAAETVSIGTAAELTAFAVRVNGGATSLNGVLTADIALQPTTNWEQWGTEITTGLTTWTPIGNKDNRYAGTFDGAGFTVSGIYINDTVTNDQGLFGKARNGSMIKNLGVTASYIKGPDEVGGIAGYMGGSISNCFNTATISGNDCVGGLAGYSGSTGISNSYNTGKITGNRYVGGIVGSSVSSYLNNCYNTGQVNGSYPTGSLAGAISGFAAMNCYYQQGTATKGVGDLSPDAVGKTEAKTNTAFAAGEVAYLLNKYNTPTPYPTGWIHWTQNPGAAAPSFALTGTNIIDKKITLNYDNPAAVLVFYGAKDSTIIGLPAAPEGYIYTYTSDNTVYSQAEMANYQFTAVDDVVFTVKKYQLVVNNEGVIEIDTATEMIDFSRYVNDGHTSANGKLMASIALRDTSGWAEWGTTAPTDTTQWIPIGTNTNPYAGTFDGAGYAVSGIYINDEVKDNQGLFGVTAAGSAIKNLGVTASYINGNQYVGGIVGRHNGSISNCYNSGKIAGKNYVGGLVGLVMPADPANRISNSYNTGMVSGVTNVGQIAGYMEPTTAISNCYYQADAAARGIGNNDDAAGQTEFKTTAAFASGEVAWRLQNGQTNPTEPVWGQKLEGGEGVEARPLLKASDRVYCLTQNKGDGSLYNQSYRNASNTTSLGEIAGITWKDALGISYPVITDAADHILYPWLTTVPTTLPMATAVYGTRRGEIGFSGASDPAGNWSWNGTAADKEQILPVANSTAYSARLIASDDPRGTIDVAITPVITPRSLIAAGVSISQPDNVNYTGAAIKPLITVSDSGAEITAADYTISYANNTSPGMATVTITGQGNYQGTLSRNFTINSPGGGGGYTPPAMSGITVTPTVISYDNNGQLVVDIAGLPARAVVYYSLDGITYSSTAPAITRAGEYQVYLRICCPGYQDFTAQTTVTVARHPAPMLSPIQAPRPSTNNILEIHLGQGLPDDRGQTWYQLGEVSDPDGLLNGAPIIDPNGLISFDFRRPLSNSDDVPTTAEQPAVAMAQPDVAGLATAATVMKPATISVLVTMENYQDTSLTVVVSESEPIGVRYLSHIQDTGWESDWVTAGELSGTSGQSKRLEALKVELTGSNLPAGASIETAVHVQNQGDLGPFAMGTAAGTSGLGLRLENITLTLENLPGYTLRYNVHVQNQGWLRDEADSSSWFTSAETAGTSALSLRLEGIRICLDKDE